jgi:hypothetical protein
MGETGYYQRVDHGGNRRKLFNNSGIPSSKTLSGGDYLTGSARLRNLRRVALGGGSARLSRRDHASPLVAK